VFGVARIGGADARCGEAGMGMGVAAVGLGDGVQGVAARATNGGGREGCGELAHAEHGQIALQAIEAADVLVQAGKRDAETLCDGDQGESVESDFVGHPGGLGDHALVSETGARHRSIYWEVWATIREAPVTQSRSSGNETAAA
jgi:hypothetical protein